MVIRMIAKDAREPAQSAIPKNTMFPKPTDEKANSPLSMLDISFPVYCSIRLIALSSEILKKPKICVINKKTGTIDSTR